MHNEAELAAALTQQAHGGLITLAIEREVSDADGIHLEAYEHDLEVVPARLSGAQPPAEIGDQEATAAAAPAAETPGATIGAIAGIQVGPDPRSFGSRSGPTRIGILAAGAGINLLLPHPPLRHRGHDPAGHPPPGPPSSPPSCAAAPPTSPACSPATASSASTACRRRTAATWGCRFAST